MLMGRKKINPSAFIDLDQPDRKLDMREQTEGGKKKEERLEIGTQ